MFLLFFFFLDYAAPLDLHSFPTRRSSDLQRADLPGLRLGVARRSFFADLDPGLEEVVDEALRRLQDRGDRKSTRLNSSHANISYAVFCLKKKKQSRQMTTYITSIEHMYLQ